MEKLSVVIPAFNEADSIASVIERIRKVLGNSDICEIIVVNDGSTDSTGEILLGTTTRVISNPRNMGYGFSLKRGITEASHECIVITDADGTYPIEEIPGLLIEYHKGFDMVVGARQGKHYWSSRWKSFARVCFKAISEFVVGRKIPDINSGLRVIRKSKIVPLFPDLSNTFSFTTSATLLFFLKFYFVTYKPISYDKRAGKSKVRHLKDTLRALQIMSEIIASYNPIKLFILLALVPFALSILFLIIGIFFQHTLITVLVLPSFFFALLLMSIGFVATAFRKR